MVYNVTIEELKQDTEGKKQQLMKQKSREPRFSPILSKKMQGHFQDRMGIMGPSLKV